MLCKQKNANLGLDGFMFTGPVGDEPASTAVEGLGFDYIPLFSFAATVIFRESETAR